MARKLGSMALSVLNDFTVLVQRSYSLHTAVLTGSIPHGRNPWYYQRPLICNIIRKHPRLLARCDECERRAARMAAGRCAFTKCHAGLGQLAMPPYTGRGISIQAVFSPFRPRGISADKMARRLLAATGPIRQDERPRLPRDVWETLRRHPVGEDVAFGQDRQGNLVMACGFGPGNELVSHALSDFLEVSGIDPERVTFVDVSGLRNVPLRLGAFLLSHRMAPELGRHLLETGYMTQGRRFGEIVEHRRHISPAIDPSRPAGG